MALNAEKAWYILQVHANFEKRVMELVKERTRSFEMQESIEEVLVPTESIVEVRKGRKVKSDKRFFPGYVLIRMVLNDETYNLVRDTPHVSGFLGADHQPQPLSQGEVDAILSQIERGSVTPRSLVSFEVGEQVSVSDGPFTSFEGIVEEIDEERSRMKVSVSIFGRATPVELDFSQVEKST